MPTDTDAPMIAVRDLSLTLPSEAGPVDILHGLDFEIAPGETVSVVGPSGSGKSSMMMLIAGLERASGGEIAVDGQELTGLSEDALARFRRERIGVVFQDFHLIPTMTAWENVAIPLEFAGRDDAFERAKTCLEQVGLGHRLHHYPGQLSGGEQQRTALARAFAPQPRLLLADEPTGNLDQETGGTVIDLLFEMQAEHRTTLILITHDPDLAARCRRRISLSDGRIAGDSARSEASGIAAQ